MLSHAVLLTFNVKHFHAFSSVIFYENHIFLIFIYLLDDESKCKVYTREAYY